MLNFVLLALAGIAVVPFVWLVCAAFKTGQDLLQFSFVPLGHLDRLTLDNFRILFADRRFADWLINSVFLASAQTVLATVLSAMGGFALAKYTFTGKRIIYAIMLLTLLVPFQVMLGGLYQLMDVFGWIDSYHAIVFPGAVSVFGLFLFRQAFLNVPDELLDAARLDGCAEWRLWWTISLPIIRPMTTTFALLAFLSSWNAYLWPQIILQDESRFTLPLGMANLLATPGVRNDFGPLMAATVLSVLPLVMLFAIAQRSALSPTAEAS